MPLVPTAVQVATLTPVKPKDVELSDLDQRLAKIRGHIEKEVKGASVLRLSGDVQPHPFLPTGSLALDCALGIGGYPRGRVVEIIGPESSGKTTLTLHAIAAAQRLGGVAFFIDAEHALDLKYAAQLDVNVKDLLLSQPDSGEQALQIVDSAMEAGIFGAKDIIVVDSVAALVPQAELDGDMGDHHVGTHARLMSQAMRKLVSKVAQTGAILFFTNQWRDKIGMGGGGFGPTKIPTGGNALKYYASVRLDIRRTGSITSTGAAASSEEGKEADKVGNKTEVKVIKNKMAPPFTEAEFIIRFGEGVSRGDELLDLGSKFKVLEKSGSWYSFEGEKIANGRENCVARLRENKDLASKIETSIRAGLHLSA